MELARNFKVESISRLHPTPPRHIGPNQSVADDDIQHAARPRQFSARGGRGVNPAACGFARFCKAASGEIPDTAPGSKYNDDSGSTADAPTRRLRLVPNNVGDRPPL